MAEEKQAGGIPETLLFIIGLLLVLGALWWVRGGPKTADDVGGFLNPPPAPMTGEAPPPTDTQPQPSANGSDSGLSGQPI